MRSTRPPKGATWLLRHFGCSPNNEAIIGDVDERYRQGHSRTWYWREAVIAIISSAFADIRSHKFLGLRAVAFGLIVLHALGNNMFSLYGRLLVATIDARLTGPTWHVGPLWSVGRVLIHEGPFPLWVHPVFSTVVCILGIGSGWIVAHFHRRPAMVLLYGLSTLLYLFAFAMVKGIEQSPLGGSSLSRYVVNTTILFTGILVGGYLSLSNPDATSREGISS